MGRSISLQKQLETGANVDRKKDGTPKATTPTEDKYLIIEIDRYT